MNLLSRERWGKVLTQKKEERKKKSKVERLNYTSYTLCSKKDRRGVGNVDHQANVAIRGAKTEETRKPKPSIPNKEQRH